VPYQQHQHIFVSFFPSPLSGQRQVHIDREQFNLPKGPSRETEKDVSKFIAFVSKEEKNALFQNFDQMLEN